MKKIFLLLVLMACTKEESPAEQVKNNPELLSGSWRSYETIVPGDIFAVLGKKIIYFNPNDNSIDWIRTVPSNHIRAGIDTSWTVNYRFEGRKILLDDPLNDKFYGEVNSISEDEIILSVTDILHDYKVEKRIYEKLE